MPCPLQRGSSVPRSAAGGHSCGAADSHADLLGGTAGILSESYLESQVAQNTDYAPKEPIIEAEWPQIVGYWLSR